jgi:hypothetical protein
MKTIEDHAMRTIGHGVRLSWIALLPALLLPACEAVPERLWDAVRARCARTQSCDPGLFAQAYASLDDCADESTGNVDWSERGEACVDAETAWNMCIAQMPCKVSGTVSCKRERDLVSFHCLSLDTNQFGTGCLKAPGDECEQACSRQTAWEPLTCSSETPGFCTCGGQQCKQGELCCYCPPSGI